VPTPISPLPAGPRAEQSSSGLGDIIVSGRYWMLNPTKHPRGNWSLGSHQGRSAERRRGQLPEHQGQRRREGRRADPPGDGGWGYLFDVQSARPQARDLFARGLAIRHQRGRRSSSARGRSPANVWSEVVDNYGPSRCLPRPRGFAMSRFVEGLPRYTCRRQPRLPPAGVRDLHRARIHLLLRQADVVALRADRPGAEPPGEPQRYRRRTGGATFFDTSSWHLLVPLPAPGGAAIARRLPASSGRRCR
jgi:hypothetical protein